MLSEKQRKMVNDANKKFAFEGDVINRINHGYNIDRPVSVFEATAIVDDVADLTDPVDEQFRQEVVDMVAWAPYEREENLNPVFVPVQWTKFVPFR